MDYRPIQADLKNEWRILVASILLAKTDNVQVRRVLPELFHRWPTFRQMSNADPAEIAGVICPCGFHNVRAGMLVRMSQRYGDGGRPVRHLPGVGQYVYDAWRIFVVEDTDFEPEDSVLREWIRRLKEE